MICSGILSGTSALQSALNNSIDECSVIFIVDMILNRVLHSELLSYHQKNSCLKLSLERFISHMIVGWVIPWISLLTHERNSRLYTSFELFNCECNMKWRVNDKELLWNELSSWSRCWLSIFMPNRMIDSVVWCRSFSSEYNSNWTRLLFQTFCFRAVHH